MRASFMHRLVRWSVFALCLVISCCRASAQSDLWENDAILTYPGTVENPPQIDAWNFVNTGTFIINFPSFQAIEYNGGAPFYETSDTVAYTNTGVMMVNTGFKFDYYSIHSSAPNPVFPSVSFDNEGSIDCGSVLDTTDPFGGLLGGFGTFFGLGGVEYILGDGGAGFAQCVVNADNIRCPGHINAGVYGLIQMQGQNVNLYQGQLEVEDIFSATNATVLANGFYETNVWFPEEYLFSTNFIYAADGSLFLTNAMAYTNLVQVATNYVIQRFVFMEDFSDPSVPFNVYFGTGGIGLGGGDVTIEWLTSYVDPSSGTTVSNYLYLNDDYLEGVSTNMLLFVPGLPPNFTFVESPAPLLQTYQATPPSPFNVFNNPFPDEQITNNADGVNAQLTSYSDAFGTNNIPNESITNLPGRVELTADNTLDLTLSQITGMNYLSLRATNQFNGSAGAFIQSPYADLNLANTNPVFYVTNVLAASTPTWGGNIKAWNTQFIFVDANGVTNDDRVLVLSSALTPTMVAQVQNLILHNTNQVVISDTFHIMRTLNVDAQSLTLTTNPPGYGSTSFEGELNLDAAGIFWQSSMPNLRYLTNNGAIRMQNLAYFGHPFYTNITAALPAVAAAGSLAKTSTGTNVVAADVVTVGTNKYVFVNSLTNKLANQVQIVPASVDGSLNNLIAAINGASGSGTVYSSATIANPLVAAGLLTNHSFTVTALTAGTAGNAIATLFTPATASANLTWGQRTLAGGVNTISAITNLTSFLTNSALINHGIFEDQGSIIYAGNFTSSGQFFNGTGSFTLQSLTTTLTNGSLTAEGPGGGDISITTSDLLTSNLQLEADRSLTLVATNSLVDTGVTNNSVWNVGSASVGAGIKVPLLPANASLLGTTIHLFAPTNYTVANVWPGVDQGASAAGFVNNLAVGQLILDVATPVVKNHNGVLSFSGAGVSNALYVDLLVLTNYATQGNATNSYNFPWLNINTNLVVYFGQAVENGVSVAEVIDNASRNGANNGRLRWAYSYAGYLSSTNLVYTNADGTVWTNTVNAALAASSHIDSDGDGFVNNADATPFFVPSELNFSLTVATNQSQKVAKILWNTIPNATNFVWFSTNLASTNWLPFTNFQGQSWYYGNNVAVTNAAHGNGFHSPQIYVGSPPSAQPDNGQQTNVWVFDVITNVPHYYKVVVWPWLNYPY